MYIIYQKITKSNKNALIYFFKGAKMKTINILRGVNYGKVYG